MKTSFLDLEEKENPMTVKMHYEELLYGKYSVSMNDLSFHIAYKFVAV